MRKNKNDQSEIDLHRRRFLKCSAVLTGAALIALPDAEISALNGLQTGKANNKVEKIILQW